MGRHKKQPVVRVYGTRAVIYLRVSTRKQVQQGYGMDAQNDACLAYAAAHGYTIVATTRDEAISGSKGTDIRHGLDEALTLCKTGQADVLLCAAIDRSSRSLPLFYEIRAYLKLSRIRFETAKEGQDLTEDNNWFMVGVNALISGDEGC